VDIRVDDKTAIVTGASRGIGLAIAHRLFESGANVVISSRNEEHLAEAIATFPLASKRMHPLVAHVGRSDDAESLVGEALSKFGSVDILVNNAGTNPYFGPLVEIDDARMQKTFEVNQASIVKHVRAAWNQWMRDHGGVVLNVASVGGLGPEPNIGWYNTTKAAVIHLTKQFAWELAPGVRVNAIAPGVIRTELARALWESHEAEVAAHIPLRRLGEPDDVASMALTLVSDAASWITGQTIVVDGGTTNQPSGGVG
jgi:NAD(P)-dependent dehydrogenase (short-subunit alcohol dehydrogenase family)